MVVFKSLVVFDLESSGLPSTGKPKITEMSLVGVLANHVLESHRKSENTPRVLQKISLCFYPQKRIDFEASEITGLDNFLLEEIPPFSEEACEMLLSFLQRMPAPLCLIAHNGMKFDFQLLKSELSAKNKALPDDIFCADSLLAFRTLFPATPRMPLTTPGITTPPRTTPSSDAVATPTSVQLGPKFDSELPSVMEQQKLNETTPKHSTRQDKDREAGCPPPLKRRNILTTNDENNGVQRVVRKNLFKAPNGKPESYKLVDLYSYIYGREPDHGHRAESDTLALLECIVATAPDFMAWLENNSLLFKKMPCMW